MRTCVDTARREPDGEVSYVMGAGEGLEAV
jgi:hypothetical protein